MGHYAKGRNAYGECARSGRRMRLRDMIADPYNGLLVDPNWAEPPIFVAKSFQDGIALHRPAPEHDTIGTVFYFGEGYDLSLGRPQPPLQIITDCIPPTVTVT